MDFYSVDVRRPAIAITALAAAGLILTGCAASGSASTAAAGSASTAATTPPSAAAQPSSAAQSSGASSSPGSSGSAAAVASSGSLPFPSTVGDTWFYKDLNGTTENKIESVTPGPSGQQVLLDSTVKLDGRTSHFQFVYVLQPNGEIAIPSTALGSPSASYSIKTISGGVYWPSAAQLASGQTLPSAEILEYTIQGKKERGTLHATVSGGGTQSVTVPAGTYSAIVVNEIVTVKLDGYSMTTDVRTWLASGVGPVQQATFTGNGTTGQVGYEEELVSFVKG